MNPLIHKEISRLLANFKYGEIASISTYITYNAYSDSLNVSEIKQKLNNLIKKTKKVVKEITTTYRKEK